MACIVDVRCHARSRLNWGHSLFLVIVTAIASEGVIAQDQRSSPQGISDGLQEIVVTALRRAENLQSTPVAVTALSEDYLEKQETINLADLNSAVPGLAV